MILWNPHASKRNLVRSSDSLPFTARCMDSKYILKSILSVNFRRVTKPHESSSLNQHLQGSLEMLSVLAPQRWCFCWAKAGEIPAWGERRESLWLYDWQIYLDNEAEHLFDSLTTQHHPWYVSVHSHLDPTSLSSLNLPTYLHFVAITPGSFCLYFVWGWGLTCC